MFSRSRSATGPAGVLGAAIGFVAVVAQRPGGGYGTDPMYVFDALAAAAPDDDKAGIFGAVRSAFVRNKTTHQHEFVEAPGGIGIVRQICAECGYVSIGVND